MKSLLTLITLSLSLLSYGQNSVNLKLIVRGFEHNQGKLKAALYNQGDHWLETAYKGRDTVIYNTGEVILLFTEVPAGEYAISLFHDENGNGELDTGTFGIPTEDYAFSNNAKGTFGPASYEDAAFSISDTETTHIININ